MKTKILWSLIFFICVFSTKAQVEISSDGTSTATAYVLFVPGAFTLSQGIQVTFKSTLVCGSPVTLKVNTALPKNIKKEGGATDLAIGDIIVGQVVNLVYDGTYWQMLSASGNAAASATSVWSLTGNTGINTTTNFLGTTDALPLIFRTNNAERMRIDGSGRMGIGTTSPNASSILDLTDTTKGLLIPRMTVGQRNAIVAPATGLIVYNIGSNKFNYYNGTAWKIFDIVPVNPDWSTAGNGGTNAATDYLGTSDALPLIFGTNSAERMRIDATGNVGIGTNSPASKFHVAGNIQTDNVLYISNQTNAIHKSTVGKLGQAVGWNPNTNVGANGLFFEAGDTEGGGFYADGDVAAIWSAGDNGILKVFDEDDLPSGNPKFIIDGSGKVGILNPFPTEALDVTGNLRFSGALMPNNNSGVSGYVLSSSGGGAAPTWIDPTTLSTNWTKSGLNLYPTSISDNVGIGTNTPGAKCDVNPGASFGGIVLEAQNSNSANSNPVIFAMNNGPGSGISSNSSGSGNAIYAYTSGGGTTLQAVNGATSGNVAYLQTNNSSNTSTTLYATSNGTSGYTLVSAATGGGSAGYFSNTSTATTLNVINNAGAGFSAAYFKGRVQIDDGTQANGRVFTSDASGNGSWAAAPATVTASNGLTKSVNDIQLGGTLLNNTTITHGNLSLTHNLTGTGNFDIQVSGVSKLFVQNSTGNVGIGKNAPTRALDLVYSGTQGAGIYVSYTNSSAAGANSGINTNAQTTSTGNIFGGYFQASGSASAGSAWGVYGYTTSTALTNYAVQAYAGGAAAGGTNIGLQASAGGATNNYAIIVPSGGGNVGIGTTAPAYNLHASTTTTLVTGNDVIGSLSEITGNGGARVAGLYGWARGAGSSGKSIGIAGVADYVNTPTDAIGVYAGFSSTRGILPATPGVSTALYAYGNGVSAAAGIFMNGSVGIGTVTPISTLDLNGSMSVPVRTMNGNTTLSSTDYFIIIGTTGIATFPTASSCPGRIYIIKSPACCASTTSPNYLNLSGTSVNNLSINTTYRFISDGTNWQQW